MEDIHNVNFVQMKIEDFEENYLKNHNFDKIDLVMSDIAPNISGIDSADIPAMLNLAEIVADVAKKALKQRGNFDLVQSRTEILFFFKAERKPLTKVTLIAHRLGVQID